MKPKVLATVILLVFVAAAVIYLVAEETRTARHEAGSQVSGRTLVESADTDGGQGAAPENAAADSAAKPGQTPPESGQAAGARKEAEERGAVRVPTRDAGAGAATANPRPGTETAARPADTRPADTNPRVVAYYFHGTQRCATCRKLEAYSHEAITLGFAAQLRDGSLEWRVVNIDEPDNKHFVDDYKLYTRSLVIVRMRQGRQVDWKNLERIWDLVDDKPGFFQYVQQEISAYMGTS